MIETVYKSPMDIEDIPLLQRKYMLLDEPIDVTEILDRLIMEEDMEYIPYKPPVDDKAVKKLEQWLKKEIKQPRQKLTPEEQREKRLTYQREYYKKNIEKRKAEMMKNYYTKKITM
jgi:hypothetical protein